MEEKSTYSTSDYEIEVKAKEILSEVGIDFREAYDSFLHLLVIKKINPLELLNSNRIDEKIPVSELCGKYTGEIWMADDFDDPLDEIAEYI